MTFRINHSGIFLDVSAVDYHADPAPTPSLSQSIAKVLIERSPLHAWTAHPRLNPDYQPDDDTKFDVGNVAHKLIIGRGKEIVTLDAPDWNATGMGKGAKTKLHEDRDAARAAGKIAVLGKTYQRASNMVAAAREQLDMRRLNWLFHELEGSGEVVIAWQEGDLWFRQMIDWLAIEGNIFADYKTTSMSVAAHCLDRMMAAAGWPIQACMAERGLDVLDPDNAGRRRYLFVVQEDERPYALNVVELTEGPMTLGRKQLDHGVNIWRQCIAANRWPGYPAEIVTPSYPGWSEAQWLEREVQHEERRSREPMLTDMAGG